MVDQATGEAPSQKIRMVRDHIRLENAHDLAAIMDTFGSSARYDDEPWDEHHTGREAVRSFYEQLLRAVPDLEIAIRKEHLVGTRRRRSGCSCRARRRQIDSRRSPLIRSVRRTFRGRANDRQNPDPALGR